MFLATGTTWESSAPAYYLALLDNQFVPSYALYLGAVGSQLTYDYFHRLQRSRLAAFQARTKIEALETETTVARLERIALDLQPEFLHRALRGVGRTIDDHRAEEAMEAIAALGDLLREALRVRNEGDMIPLNRELELTEGYLRLELAASNVRARVEVAARQDVLSLPVPRRMLQPFARRLLLITGAGVKEGAVIRITARQAGGTVNIDFRVEVAATHGPVDGAEEVVLETGAGPDLRVLESHWRGDAGRLRLVSAGAG